MAANGTAELIRLCFKSTGSTAGLLFQEIVMLLRLPKGGIIRDGEKWVWKKADDLAERFNLSERTVRRHLNVLVEEGWLKREKHRAKDRRDQTYFYAIGRLDQYEALKAYGEGADVDKMVRHDTSMNRHNWFALGDDPKSRLEPEELVQFQPEQRDQVQPDTAPACIKGTEHSSKHTPEHPPTRRPKAPRPKKIKKKAEHMTGQATPMPEPLPIDQLKAGIALARKLGFG